MRDRLILFGWCLFVFGYGISVGTLYRTEALRAIIGRSALEGDWLVPTLYGEPFLTKPPGQYVAIALASLPFGEVSTVSARIPSVVAATITVLLFHAVFLRLFDRKRALQSAALVPVSFLWLEKVPSAEIDMLLVMWVAGANLAIFLAVENNRFHWWLLALVCTAAGFLTKWTAPAFVYLTVVPLLLVRGQLLLLFGWRHLTALTVSVAVIAIWAALVIDQVGWSLLRETFLQEARQRFEPNHAGRAYPWAASLAHPFEVLGANLPWSLLALTTLRRTWRERQSDGVRHFTTFLHCWAWPNLFFWALPAQHHVRYSLPIAPAISALGIIALFDWLRSCRPVRQHQVVAVFLLAWAVIRIIHVEAIVQPRTAKRHARESAAEMRAVVRDGETLYIGRLKDEGVMFYYGRPARRLMQTETAIAGTYLALIEQEWQTMQDRVVLLARVNDQQGAIIYVVRMR